MHKVGKGTVYAGQNLTQVFSALNLKPDFDYSKRANDSDLEFVHRKLNSGDIYFVNNRSDHEEALDATFRVAGKAPELWRAETGYHGSCVIQNSGWAYDRAASARTVGHGVRGVPQTDIRNFARHPETDGDESGHH